MRVRSKSAPWLLALLLAPSGCGFEGQLPTTYKPPTPPAPPTQAAITLSLSSSPIDAVASADGSTPWSAQWTLIVQETGGIGGNIDSVHATLSDSSGASITESALDATQLSEQLGGSNHIRGGGNQRLPMTLGFDFPAGTLSGNLHVALQLTDDRGNAVSAAVDTMIYVCVLQQLSPPDGAVLDNGCTSGQNGILWEFNWSACPAAESYEIFVKDRNSQAPFVDVRGLTTPSYSVLQNGTVFEEARFGWSWKVRARVNGTMTNWSPERSFEVEPVNTDCSH